MKHPRLSALLLSFAMLLGTPALAAENSTQNFTRTRTYQGAFSDLDAGSVFYDNVAALYEYGLSQGNPDGSFGLQDPLTVGQVVIFAGRIRSLWETGDPEAGPAAFADPDRSLSSAYLRYLQDRGLLGHELDARLTANATRAEVAHVLAPLLPPEALPPVHQDLINEAYATHRILPDVTEYTPYQQDILQLYRTGVSQGVDAKGSYRPHDLITRGAAAAMLTRMVDPSLRTAPDWYSASGVTLGELVPDAQPVEGPLTSTELDACVRHMLHSGEDRMELQYETLSAVQASKILNQALTIVKSYCEQSYNTATCNYTNSGAMTLAFSSTAAEDGQLQSLRTQTMTAATAVHDRLWSEGAITAAMSDSEKALVYYNWVAENCAYDADATDTSLSHLPYSLFYTGQSVCDGYTGAYNLLLKLEGIPCTALSNKGHIWTVAELDGQQVHIDTTWGDLGATADPDCFAMTAEESYALHPW